MRNRETRKEKKIEITRGWIVGRTAGFKDWERRENPEANRGAYVPIEQPQYLRN
jgi:hypothetical protein